MLRNRMVTAVTLAALCSAFVGSLCQAQTSHAPNPTDLYDRIAPSVVTVVVYGRDGKPIRSGSGVVLSADGTILTNYHVVEGGTFFDVVYSGSRRATETTPARPMKCGSAVDLAALRISPRAALHPARLSNGVPKIGSRVFAIGSPYELEGTISEGIVSQLRNDGFQVLIQTTAAISPGSSGGGLFAESGALVGITTMSIRGGQGLNFAIPSSSVDRLTTCQTFKPRPPNVESNADTMAIGTVSVAIGMPKEKVLAQLRALYAVSLVDGQSDVWSIIERTGEYRLLGIVTFTDELVSSLARN